MSAAASLTAQTRGVIVDNATHKAVVFNADTDTITGSVTIPGAATAEGNCTVTLDQSLAFVTDFNSHLWAINLEPPSLAGPPNPIPISNFGEDTALSPNGKQVVACDGSALQPVSVVDVASRTQIGTLATGSDCNSVDVTGSGSVLVTSFSAANVRRVTIDATGKLTNTGEVMSAGGDPNNVVAAPNSASGVVINRTAANIRSFKVPGLTPVDTRSISGFGISGVFNPTGDRFYVRNNGGTVNVFTYNSATGGLSATPLFSISGIAATQTFFGMDQMAIDPTGKKLYVSQPGAVKIFNATTGAPIGSLVSPDISSPIGVCIAACRPDDDPSGDDQCRRDN
jgi:hypothetical protein